MFGPVQYSAMQLQYQLDLTTFFKNIFFSSSAFVVPLELISFTPVSQVYQ
jgi:hypothetical protein